MPILIHHYQCRRQFSKMTTPIHTSSPNTPHCFLPLDLTELVIMAKVTPSLCDFQGYIRNRNTSSVWCCVSQDAPSSTKPSWCEEAQTGQCRRNTWRGSFLKELRPHPTQPNTATNSQAREWVFRGSPCQPSHIPANPEWSRLQLPPNPQILFTSQIWGLNKIFMS